MSNNFPATEPLGSYYFKETEEIICGHSVPSILTEYVENYPSVVDRFFTRFYYKKSGTNPQEIYKILFHSNRICLIGLGPAHPALSKAITNISFNIGNMDRSSNKVSGKGKKGGMALQDDSIVAVLTTDDGAIYKIPSCVRGKLIEVNERILTNFELVKTEGVGYFVVVLPKPENCDEIKRNLLNQEQFDILNNSSQPVQ